MVSPLVPALPIVMYDEDESRNVSTAKDYWQAVYDGFRVSGPIPAPPRSAVRASLSDLDALETKIGSAPAPAAAPIGYANAETFGASPTATAAANDAAFAAAIASGKAVYVPGRGRANPYKISVPIDLTAGFKTFRGDFGSTFFEQTTDTAAVMKVGEQRNNIGGFTLRHNAQPSATQGNGLECINLYQSHISNVDIENAKVSFKRTSGFFFSNLIEHLATTGFYESAIVISNAGSTGSAWNNIYVNNMSDSGGVYRPSTQSPVVLEYINDTVFNQLNIEHTMIASGNALLMNGVTNLVINGLHLEGASTLAWGSSLVNSYGNRSKVVVNGLACVFTDISPAAGDTGGRSLVRAAGGGRIMVNNIHAEGNSNTRSQAAQVASTETGNNSNVWIGGGVERDIFTAAYSGDVWIPNYTRLT